LLSRLNDDIDRLFIRPSARPARSSEFWLAFGMLFSRRTIVLLIPPIPMPAIVFVILYRAS